MILRRLGPAHDPVENMLVGNVENPLELAQTILVESIQMRLAESAHEQVQLAETPAAGAESKLSSAHLHAHSVTPI